LLYWLGRFFHAPHLFNVQSTTAESFAASRSRH
jgi:hypothetical protein